MSEYYAEHIDATSQGDGMFVRKVVKGVKATDEPPNIALLRTYDEGIKAADEVINIDLIKTFEELKAYASSIASNMHWLDDGVITLDDESWQEVDPEDTEIGNDEKKYKKLSERVPVEYDMTKVLKKPWC